MNQTVTETNRFSFYEYIFEDGKKMSVDMTFIKNRLIKYYYTAKRSTLDPDDG